jgi:hypothetical protein
MWRWGCSLGGDTGEVHVPVWPRVLVLPSRVGGVEGAAGGVRWWVSSILLGPERTNTASGPLGPLWRGLLFRLPGAAFTPDDIDDLARLGGVLGGWWCVWVVGWLLVEICIVDASIFCCCLWSSCVGQTVDALVPGADEGRGRPR